MQFLFSFLSFYYYYYYYYYYCYYYYFLWVQSFQLTELDGVVPKIVLSPAGDYFVRGPNSAQFTSIMLQAISRKNFPACFYFDDSRFEQQLCFSFPFSAPLNTGILIKNFLSFADWFAYLTNVLDCACRDVIFSCHSQVTGESRNGNFSPTCIIFIGMAL